MIDTQTIENVRRDGLRGLTHAELKAKYDITDEQDFAINYYGNGSPIEVARRLEKLRPGMSVLEIRSVMVD